MEVKYEMKVTIDNEIVFSKEATIINGWDTCCGVMGAGLIALMARANQMCQAKIKELFGL